METYPNFAKMNFDVWSNIWYNCITDLKKENKWLKEVDSCALQKCVFNLDDAFKNFFRGNRYPKYRTKGEHESYTTNNTLNEYMLNMKV